MQVCDSGVSASGVPPAHRVRGDHQPAPAPSSCPAGQRPVCGGGQAGQLHPNPARADTALRQGRCAARACAISHCLNPYHGQPLSGFLLLAICLGNSPHSSQPFTLSSFFAVLLLLNFGINRLMVHLFWGCLPVADYWPKYYSYSLWPQNFGIASTDLPAGCLCESTILRWG